MEEQRVRYISPRIGFNHNLRYRGQVYHIQTEDSGREKGHIFTHVFVGGTVISSRKTHYLKDEGDTERIVLLMQESHKSMMRRLCNGEFDAQIVPFIDSPANESPPARSPVIPTLSSSTVDAYVARITALIQSINMSNVTQSLNKIESEVAGILGAALVDHESGMCLGTVGVGINLDVAAAGNMEVVRAKLRVMRELGIEGGIEDILITLKTQYHIIRPVSDSLFLYLAIDRKSGNLAMARHKMAAIGESLAL